MGWETRNNRRYFYHKHRGPDGKVISTYISRNHLLFPYFQLLDAISQERRAMQADRPTGPTPAQTGLADLESLTDAFIGAANAARDAELHAAGYHRHKGQWRKARTPRPPDTA
jgi:hypothetical protein